MKNIVVGILSVIFFVIYWNILILIWNEWVPLNSATDLFAIIIVTFINIPLSVISAEKAIKIIKKS